MNCSYCNKPVILVPSASERAKRFGGKASDYTKLFPYHVSCMIRNRENDALRLIQSQSKTGDL